MSRLTELLESESSHFNSSRTIPIAPLPSDYTGPPSTLYQLVHRHNHYPPILREQSWTKSAPYKEQKEHRTPVESIANNYTPPSADLKIRTLHHVSKGSPQYARVHSTRPGCLPPPALPGFHEKQLTLVAEAAGKAGRKGKKRGSLEGSRNGSNSRKSNSLDSENYSRPLSPSEQFNR